MFDAQLQFYVTEILNAQEFLEMYVDVRLITHGSPHHRSSTTLPLRGVDHPSNSLDLAFIHFQIFLHLKTFLSCPHFADADISWSSDASCKTLSNTSAYPRREGSLTQGHKYWFHPMGCLSSGGNYGRKQCKMLCICYNTVFPWICLLSADGSEELTICKSLTHLNL